MIKLSEPVYSSKNRLTKMMIPIESQQFLVSNQDAIGINVQLNIGNEEQLYILIFNDFADIQRFLIAV